jgi:hypothetical protein
LILTKDKIINKIIKNLKKILFKSIKKLKKKGIKLKLNNPKKTPVKKLSLKFLIPMNLQYTLLKNIPNINKKKTKK